MSEVSSKALGNLTREQAISLLQTSMIGRGAANAEKRYVGIRNIGRGRIGVVILDPGAPRDKILLTAARTSTDRAVVSEATWEEAKRVNRSYREGRLVRDDSLLLVESDKVPAPEEPAHPNAVVDVDKEVFSLDEDGLRKRVAEITDAGVLERLREAAREENPKRYDVIEVVEERRLRVEGEVPEDFDSYTIAQLSSYALSLGVEVPHSMRRKTDIQQHILGELGVRIGFQEDF